MVRESSRTLVIRADADSQIGTGHVMRCVALGQAWQDRGGRVVIVTCRCPAPLVRRLAEEGIEHRSLAETPGGTQDCKATVSLAAALDCRWIVADGYHFTAKYQRMLRNAGFKVLAVDDYGHCDVWCADAVLNQNIFATERSYESEVADCQFLLGTKFALLRREFVQAEPIAHRNGGPIQRLVVTLGGGDPDNATGKVLELLNHIAHPGLNIRLLVGSVNLHLEGLTTKAEQSKHHVEILTNVRDMPALFRWADGIISAAGSTCWEWLFYRLPAAVITIASNQRRVAKSLAEEGLAIDLGWHH